MSVPSKTLSILASGRPVLAAVPEDSEIRRIIEAARCGQAVRPEDADALAAAVREMRGDRERLEWFGRNARDYAVEHYHRSDIVNRYHRLLTEVAAEGR
jgi:colanic acid biosynthesis glycosyl transferase WcaI